MVDSNTSDRRQIGARVSSQDAKKLKMKALKEGTSIQQMIEKWVSDYVKGSRA